MGWQALLNEDDHFLTVVFVSSICTRRVSECCKRCDKGVQCFNSRYVSGPVIGGRGPPPAGIISRSPGDAVVLWGCVACDLVGCSEIWEAQLNLRANPDHFCEI